MYEICGEPRITTFALASWLDPGPQDECWEFSERTLRNGWLRQLRIDLLFVSNRISEGSVNTYVGINLTSMSVKYSFNFAENIYIWKKCTKTNLKGMKAAFRNSEGRAMGKILLL